MDGAASTKSDRAERADSQLEYRVVRPGGRTVWLMVNGSLSEQRGNTLLTGMVIDISHQKSMEERLCCKSWYQRTLCVENNGPIS